MLTTGSRGWDDWAPIVALLIELPDNAVVVHGDCPQGADRIVDRVAAGCGYTVESHPANWYVHKKRAGPIRNSEMVKLGAHQCVAFSRDSSPGTTDCANKAKRAGIPVLPILWEERDLWTTRSFGALPRNY
jgi:hypothetical protein